MQNNNIEFIQQFRAEWLGRKSLDFYLPEYKLGIECQGEQHFRTVPFHGIKDEKVLEENLEKLQKRDRKKREQCLAKGIQILYFCTNGETTDEYELIRTSEELLSKILEYGKDSKNLEN